MEGGVRSCAERSAFLRSLWTLPGEPESQIGEIFFKKTDLGYTGRPKFGSHSTYYRKPPVPEALEIAQNCARCADDIQAEDIVILDLRGISMITDFFVICTGTSMPHLKAIRRDVRAGVEERIGEKARSSEGNTESQWMVIDYVDVIVHIFHRDKREVYALEDLWSDAPRIDPELPPQA